MLEEQLPSGEVLSLLSYEACSLSSDMSYHNDDIDISSSIGDLIDMYNHFALKRRTWDSHFGIHLIST